MLFRRQKEDGSYTRKRFKKVTPGTLQQLSKKGWELVDGTKDVDVENEINEIKNINKTTTHIPGVVTKSKKPKKKVLVDDSNDDLTQNPNNTKQTDGDNPNGNKPAYDETFTVKVMREIAKNNGVKNYNRLKKADLINELNK